MADTADDEDDYMSDNFLVESKTTKPGLSWGKHTVQKQKEAKHKAINAQHRTKFKPVKEQEQEHRLKGLNSALSSQNKGFALLEKMGYKRGMGLGKEGGGRSEPITVEIKTGRGGLGRETELRDRKERQQRQYQEALRHRAAWEVEHRQDFRQRMSHRFADKEAEKDLCTSQTACQHLDLVKEIGEAVEPWYWPKEPPAEAEEAEEEEEEEEEEEVVEEPGSHMSPAEKLSHITRYLRSQHSYCIWCGTSYNDDNDLAENCPGDTADDHR